MEVILPTTMTVTMGAIAAFLTIFASIMGVYYRLSGQVRHLERKFDSMVERNKLADAETEAVKTEQNNQRLTVAVMAEQINNVSATLSRIDTNIGQMVTKIDKIRGN